MCLLCISGCDPLQFVSFCSWFFCDFWPHYLPFDLGQIVNYFPVHFVNYFPVPIALLLLPEIPPKTESLWEELTEVWGLERAGFTGQQV